MIKTNVYFDGFNFYYGCFGDGQNRSAKWTDLRSLCSALFPNDTIRRIHNCTAIVKATQSDRDKPVRQQTYPRALRSTGMFYVHLGSFVERPKRGVLASLPPWVVDPPCLVGRVGVLVWEGKGSDVNLATVLLRDAFLGEFEQAVVVSNDSDLAGAVRVVRVDAGLPVQVVSPHATATKAMRRAASAWRVLDQAMLANHPLPPTIPLPDGTVLLKPRDW